MLVQGAWAVRCFAAGCVAALLLSSCSSSGQAELEVDGPEVTAPDTKAGGDSPVTTSEVDIDRAQGLSVESPSTTFSTDPDEQKAADVVYLYWALHDGCAADLEACDPEKFRRIATQSAIDNDQIWELVDEGYKSVRLDFEPEFEIRWLKTIDDGDVPVMQVLTCVHRYNYIYEADATPQTAEIKQAVLTMNRVIKRDGRWQFDGYINIARATPEANGRKVCQDFDGEPQEEALELAEEGPRE